MRREEGTKHGDKTVMIRWVLSVLISSRWKLVYVISLLEKFNRCNSYTQPLYHHRILGNREILLTMKQDKSDSSSSQKGCFSPLVIVSWRPNWDYREKRKLIPFSRRRSVDPVSGAEYRFAARGRARRRSWTHLLQKLRYPVTITARSNDPRRNRFLHSSWRHRLPVSAWPLAFFREHTLRPTPATMPFRARFLLSWGRETRGQPRSFG